MNSLALTLCILIVVFARFGMAKQRCKDLGDTVAKGDLVGVKRLLKMCVANPVVGMPPGSQPVLHRAVELARPDMVYILLDRGADPHRRDPHRGGVTPLHLAANSTDDVETMTHLLLREVDRMARDAGDRVPLHYAARRGALSAARLLLTACNLACRLAQLRARESHRMMRPVDFAVAHGKTYMAQWLRRVMRESNEAEMMSMKNGLRDTYVKKHNCRNLISQYGYLSQVRILLRRCEIESQDVAKRTILQYASEKASLDVVFTLLLNGADVRRGRGIYEDQTPLVFACSHGYHQEPVALLLLHEPDRLFQDKFGNTALHYAARKNAAAWARMLLTNCNAACKLRQLRVFNNEQRMPVDMTPITNASVISWLNEITREAAEIRVQELQEKPKHSYGAASANGKLPCDDQGRVREKSSKGKNQVARKSLPTRQLLADRTQLLEAQVANITRQLDRLLTLKDANHSLSTAVPQTTTPSIAYSSVRRSTLAFGGTSRKYYPSTKSITGAEKR